MLLPFSTRFNPLLLPSRFPSMTLTSSPSPNIAGIVRVDIPDIVFHIVTKPPSALSAPAPADAASFLKGAASPPSCRCSWQHTGEKKAAHWRRKKAKRTFRRVSLPFKVCTLDLALLQIFLIPDPAHLPAPLTRIASNILPLRNNVKSNAEPCFEIRVGSDYSLKEKQTQLAVDLSNWKEK